jgi:hypothetical protein
MGSTCGTLSHGRAIVSQRRQVLVFHVKDHALRKLYDNVRLIVDSTINRGFVGFVDFTRLVVWRQEINLLYYTKIQQFWEPFLVFSDRLIYTS